MYDFKNMIKHRITSHTVLKENNQLDGWYRATLAQSRAQDELLAHETQRKQSIEMILIGTRISNSQHEKFAKII